MYYVGSQNLFEDYTEAFQAIKKITDMQTQN